MKKKNKFQMFNAPDGMIGRADIQVRARELDFVTSFANDIQALLDVMGITRMIRKQNGTVLKTKKVSGVLKDGHIGEGELIPFSKYEVVETPMGSIEIEKFAKATSLEAIADKGYAAAVADTDEEFKNDLRDVVMNRFYNMLRSGILTSNEPTFQMAIAMAIGRVRAKFKAMHKGITGVAVWVNELDLYEYLGNADVTLQTAFGLNYLQNFLGANIMFVSAEIPRGQVIATPINNIIAYYVNPSDSEFAQAGLEYTADAETGFVGFHAQGNYNRALSEAFALLGLRLFAEYLDGIAVITFTSDITLGIAPETETILGKNPADLQSNVVIGPSGISGTLKYVENFDQFSTGAKGNFLALKYESDADEVKVGLVPSMGSGMVTLDADMNSVMQITDASTQSLKVVMTKGGVEQTVYYELDKLFCEKETPEV